jgi:hypothetical protein
VPRLFPAVRCLALERLRLPPVLVAADFAVRFDVRWDTADLSLAFDARADFVFRGAFAGEPAFCSRARG